MGSSCGKGSISQKTVITPVKTDKIHSSVNTEQSLQQRNDAHKKRECLPTETTKESTNGEEQASNTEQSKAKKADIRNEINSCIPPIEDVKDNHNETTPETRIVLSLEQKGLFPPRVFTSVEQERLVMHQFAQIQRPLDRYVYLMALQV